MSYIALLKYKLLKYIISQYEAILYKAAYKPQEYNLDSRKMKIYVSSYWVPV